MQKLKNTLKYALLIAVYQKLISGFAVREVPPDHRKAEIVHSVAHEAGRGRERHAPQREICHGCNRPRVLCLCPALPEEKLRTTTNILILQHPNEFRKKTFSTVPLLSLVLENVQVKVGYRFEVDELPMVKQMMLRGRRPLLLFPGEDAVPLEGLRPPAMKTDCIQDSVGPDLLILLDGTWAEAKRMALQSSELVERCQLVTFSANQACLYDYIRKEPKVHCYSTLEACARVLVHLEGAFEEARYLEDALRLMVKTKLEMEAGRGHDDRNQYGRERDRRLRHRQRTKQALRYRPEPRIINQESKAVLRPLTPDDAEAVDANSYHQSPKSLSIIKSRISNGFACFGIEQQGNLVAHVLRCEDGCLGMIHVDAVHQGKGYGEMLLAEASAALDHAGLPKMTLIKEGNTAMESLFQNAGWNIAEDKPIRHEGYQRRRWTQSKTCLR